MDCFQDHPNHCRSAAFYHSELCKMDTNPILMSEEAGNGIVGVDRRPSDLGSMADSRTGSSVRQHKSEKLGKKLSAELAALSHHLQCTCHIGDLPPMVANDIEASRAMVTTNGSVVVATSKQLLDGVAVLEEEDVILDDEELVKPFDDDDDDDAEVKHFVVDDDDEEIAYDHVYVSRLPHNHNNNNVISTHVIADVISEEDEDMVDDDDDDQYSKAFMWSEAPMPIADSHPAFQGFDSSHLLLVNPNSRLDARRSHSESDLVNLVARQVISANGGFSMTPSHVQKSPPKKMPPSARIFKFKNKQNRKSENRTKSESHPLLGSVRHLFGQFREGRKSFRKPVQSPNGQVSSKSVTTNGSAVESVTTLV